jgi:hypothetical protein
MMVVQQFQSVAAAVAVVEVELELKTLDHFTITGLELPAEQPLKQAV